MNNKRGLIIFIGKPGVGKSTLINSLSLSHKVIDVFSYVFRYMKMGEIPEVETIHAYREMYEDIFTQRHETDLILELGTSHPELNVSKLKELEEKFILKIFLCEAPKYICQKRAEKREIKFDRKALKRRVERDFPNSHIKLLEERGIKYEILDMTRSLKDIKNEVDKSFDEV